MFCAASPLPAITIFIAVNRLAVLIQHLHDTRLMQIRLPHLRIRLSSFPFLCWLQLSFSDMFAFLLDPVAAVAFKVHCAGVLFAYRAFSSQDLRVYNRVPQLADDTGQFRVFDVYTIVKHGRHDCDLLAQFPILQHLFQPIKLACFRAIGRACRGDLTCKLVF